MALTRNEFLRLLPVAVDHAEYRIMEDSVVHTGGEWRIALEKKPERRIALLVMPVLGVTVEISQANPDKASRFVERFLLGYQRAGG
jgi:hypothetical protein